MSNTPPDTTQAAQQDDHKAALLRTTAEDEWMELFKTAFWAIAVALVIRTFMFEPFNIPSGSMKPNLLVGDYLFVSKYSYGYSRYSLPFGLPVIPGRVLPHLPRQGEVAVFKLPTDTGTDYIKRVIGLPGDRLQMMAGRLYINGRIVPREEVGVTVDRESDGTDTAMRIFEETLPNGVKHIIYEETDAGPLDDTQQYVVPEGHYFMMGDNRDNSQDSRVGDLVGYVPFQNFVGRAERIFFSTNGKAAFWQFWRWPVSVRYTRIFKDIE